MPFKDLYNLDWSTFQSHLLYTSQELYKDKLFADVTLLSDDLIQIKAHKTVLGSASEFFKQLFTENESDSGFLILLGVQSKDLKAVMEFIYLGGTKIAEEYVSTFLETARHLGIKQLNMIEEECQDKTEVLSDAFEVNKTRNQKEKKPEAFDIPKSNQLSSGGFYSNLGCLQSDILKLENTDSDSQRSSLQKETSYQDYQHESCEAISNQEKKSNKECAQCSAKFVNNYSLRRHISSVHNKLTFECDKCSKKVSTIDSLKRHKKMLHGGMVLNCSYCNYSTVWPFHLKEHNTSKHPAEADVKLILKTENL